jgi:amino-acid N-acetyltransferase
MLLASPWRYRRRALLRAIADRSERRTVAMHPSIARAQSSDAAAIRALLEAQQLPVDGLSDHLQTLLVAKLNGTVVGSAGLELHTEGALLRSVAVTPDHQGQHLGGDLTSAAIDLARTMGAPAIYLLTTTAEGYFPRFGFERIQRADVPSGVQTSVEFTSACPASAVVMRKTL